MTIGTGDSVRKYSATTVTLEANGASIANNAIGQADDASYDLTATDHGDAPHAVFAASFSYASAPSDNGPVVLVIQAVAVDGANDEPAPTSGYQPRRAATFYVKGTTTSPQYAEAIAYNIPRKGKAWLLNQSGQQIGTGWTLKMTPVTFGPK